MADRLLVYCNKRNQYTPCVATTVGTMGDGSADCRERGWTAGGDSKHSATVR